MDRYNEAPCMHFCFEYLNNLIYLWAQWFVKYPTIVISYVGTYTYVTVVRSQMVVLLLSVYCCSHCLVGGFVSGRCFVVQYWCCFWFCNHLAVEKIKAGCFTLIVS